MGFVQVIHFFFSRTEYFVCVINIIRVQNHFLHVKIYFERGHVKQDRLVWSPDAALMDTVARLQLDMEEMRAGSRCHRTPPLGNWNAQGHQRQVAFTSTNVPRFTGVTSWEQYRQVFDAIVLSNGWDDVMAALQLLSHPEGDALNVALLVTESMRATRVGLVGALTSHYGSPGLPVAPPPPPKPVPSGLEQLPQ